MFRRSSALRSLLVLTPLFLRLASPAQTSTSEPKAANPSAGDVPVLVELFTSEGCSSCPPADLFLQKLDANQPLPGAHFIVLSEHVTYWDHDGWKDPNSSSTLTERQSSYEGVLGEKESFTPQFIVDGTQEFSFANSNHIEDILRKATDNHKLSVRIGAITFDPANPNVLRAHVETDPNSGKKNADVYVAVALDHAESQVLRGENGGRHLVHVAVVQTLQKIGKLPKGQAFATDVQLKLKPGTDPGNLRLIAFVQEPGPGKLLGAAVRKPAS
jgi:hypothetical protein